MKSLTHYINAAKSRSSNYLYKRLGWTTDRKIVVIESDDWGSIRMPSVSVLNELMAKGVKLHPELGVDRYDTLASNDDLELLMEVLSSVKDNNDNPAKITLNCVMTNPDFIKIKDSGFTEYHYELFTDTLKRYPNHNRSFALWREGIQHKIFKPQFHAREHLNVQLWLEALRKNYPGVRDAFEKGVFSNHISNALDERGRFLEAYNVKTIDEYPFIKESIQDGLKLFYDFFGFSSKSMIAPNYTWDKRIEKFAYLSNIEYIQGTTKQRNTIYNKNLNKKASFYHFTGERNQYGQIYLIRNCFYEPSHDKRLDYRKCLLDIDTAFRLKKPAVICSHRLNFIGELDKKNRDANLHDFAIMLRKIVDKYQDVEFFSSDELGDMIKSSNYD